MPTERANPYNSPGVASGDGPVSSVVVTPLFVVAVVLTGTLFFAMLFTRGPFLETYADFGSELPNPTIIAMSPWSLMAVALLLFTTIGKQFAVQFRSYIRVWNAIACILAIVLGLCYLSAIFRPFIGSLHSLSLTVAQQCVVA